MTFRLAAIAVALVAAAPAAAHAAATSRAPGLRVLPPPRSAARAGTAGAGRILTTADGGQIFGFDVDQNGNDGALASFSDTMSVQTFNQKTGKITKSIGIKGGRKTEKGDDYVFDGVFAGDVGLVDFQKAGIPGKTPAHDMYKTLAPVSGMQLNGVWNPTLQLFNVLGWAENQTTTTSALYGYQREGSDSPLLIVANIGANTVSNVIQLSAQEFSIPTFPSFAADTVNGRAVFATSPSAGAAGGPPPVLGTIDLASAQVTQFNGVACPGLAGCGYANGIGYDSSTGIACTTTELDGGVEFYNIAQQTGAHEFMPNAGGQTFAGGYVASDPIHGLFLIAQTFSSTAQSGSSIQVYGEDGTFIESINGLNFTNAGSLVIPVRIAINPKARSGWVNGPAVSQIQQFSY